MIKPTPMVTAVVATAFAATAWAAVGYKDGNDLLAACTESSIYGLATCFGYLDGIADAMNANALHGYRACIPREVQNNQLKDVVTLYLKVHAAERHYLAAGLVADAFANAFPCR